MGFGLNVKVEVPKVEVPKVDVAAAAKSVTDAVSGTVDNAKSTVNNAVSAATDAANSVVSVATKAVASLTTVAGAIADVAVSFTGAIEDFALEPHLSLNANASFGKTNFEKGPILIRVEMTSEEAKGRADTLHLRSSTFKAEKKISEFTEQDCETIGIVFENAPMDESYTLEMTFGNGGTITLFENVSYGNLKKTKNGCTS